MDFYVIKSPAKINLYLNIGELILKEKNGCGAQYYHLLNSYIFKTNSLHDNIRLRSVREDSVSCTISAKSSINDEELNQLNGKNNIAYKAVLALKNYALKHKSSIRNKKYGAEIIIDKNIPIAAGLGGGSSNAASVLIALNEMWDLHFDTSILLQIGAELGCDVPLFVENHYTMFIDGVGDEVHYHNMNQKYKLILVNPMVKIDTSLVYSTFDRMILTKEIIPQNKNIYQDYMSSSNAAKILLNAPNDLQKAAEKICPEIGELLNFLSKMPGVIASKMSGSGATCFALFPTEDDSGEKAINSLQDVFPSYWKHLEEVII